MIVITGGGTGGHLAVAGAVKEALGAQGIKPLFIGSTAGLDRGWFERDEGFSERFFLESRGVMNKSGLGKLAALWNTLRLTLHCRAILKKRGATSVLSVGGYSAAPAALAALTLRIPLYIHEQNAVPGTLNRLLRPFAKGFYSSFEPGCDCPDYPVKSIFFETARTRGEVKCVIFLGGSQGAEAINRFAREVAPLLKTLHIAVIHQTGKRDLETMKRFYEEAGIDAVCFDFDPNLIERIQKADLAVARAGAGTLFELTANGLPALYVPYPFAAGDHQRANAKFLSDRDLSWQIDQNALNPHALKVLLERDLGDVSKRLRALIKPGGAACLAEQLTQPQPRKG